MKIEEVAKRALQTAREVKEARAKDTHGDDRRPDLSPMVQGFRGDRPVVMFFHQDIDRDAALQAVELAAVGFGCDVVSMTVDSYVAVNEKINPLTGKRWAPGDMQDLAENHQGIEKGWIREGLMVMVVNRAGDVASATATYRLVEKRSALGPQFTSYAVEWLTENVGVTGDDTPPDVRFGGYVTHVMQEAMKRTTIDQLLAQLGTKASDFGLTPEQALTHQDCAAVKLLYQHTQWRGGVLLVSDDPERAAIIDESFAGTSIKTENVTHLINREDDDDE